MHLRHHWRWRHHTLWKLQFHNERLQTTRLTITHTVTHKRGHTLRPAVRVNEEEAVSDEIQISLPSYFSSYN